jgi:CubicO group peptidase (beta-lactamase class C family)
MWFANNTTTLRYTENHSSITTITLSTAVEYLANDGKYLWAGGGNTVYLIDPTTDTVYDSFSLTKMLSIASMLTYTPE